MAKLTNSDIITIFNVAGQQTTVKGKDTFGPNFKIKELSCPSGKIMRVHGGFGEELNVLRHRVGFPLVVNSCCRTPEHNAAVGGHPNSLHLTENPKHPTQGCMAVDISTNGWTLLQLTVMVAVAKDLKWSIGHSYQVVEGKAKGFMHLDRRIEIGLPQVEFYY